MTLVLIVDDEQSNLNLYEEMLGDLGHQSKKAADGEEAMELFRRNEFALVVTDLNMPKMDGILLARAIKLVKPALPIILVTTQTCLLPADISLFDAFINKPAYGEKFISCIRQFLK